MRHGLADGRFQIVAELASGNFGQVVEAIDMSTGERVAVKLVPSWQPAHLWCLGEEKAALTALDECGVAPRMVWSGAAGKYEAVAMDLLGPTLENIVDAAGGTLPLPKVARLAEELISVLECIHEQGLLHGDIKPDNFCTGRGSSSDKLFAIDFGLARWYRHRETDEHLPYLQNRPFAGNPKYASIAAHLGVVLSRRDDLESLGYMLIHWLTGTLPWRGAGDRWSVRKIKLLTPLDEVCANCPPEFLEFMRYVQGLNFEDRPDYDKLRALFRGLAGSLDDEDRAFWSQEFDVSSGRQSLDNLDVATKGSPPCSPNRTAAKPPVVRRRKRDILRRWLGLA